MRMAMSRFKDRIQNRDEVGAGALLPIITIGTIILAIAVSVASTVAFASTISADQKVAIEADIELKSVLNSFEASMLSSSPVATASVSGAGNYKAYYSAAASAPASVADPGVAYVPGTGIPSNARWLLAEIATDSGQDELTVYQYAPGEANNLMGRAIAWDGALNLINTKVASEPGVLTPLSIFASNRASSGAITIRDGSTVEGNVYAEHTASGATNSVNNSSTVKGSFFSSRALNLNGGSKIIGDGYAESIVGSDALAGVLGKRVTGSEAAATRPKISIPTTTTNQYDVPAAGVNRVELAGAQCNTSSSIKSQIESYTVPTMLVLPSTCLSTSRPFGDLTVSPKTEIYISSGTAQIRNLTVDGSADGDLGFAIGEAATFANVTYTSGAKGAIATGGNTTITDSKIVGAITRLSGTTVGSLNMTNVDLSYYPVDLPIAQSCSSTCIASVPQLIRVS